jgi:uncharacterized protein
MTMVLKEKWEADVKQAMLAKDEVRRDTLRLVLSELKKLDMEKGIEITPEIEQDVLLKAVKQRQQSIAEFEKAGRADLVAKEKAELEVLLGYMPKQLSEAEAKAIITALAKELGVSAKKDQGTVMKAIMARYKGQLDGRIAQKILGEVLT